MTAVILGLHLMVAVVMVFMVLMQRSEGGALGMGGGGGGNILSGRGAADALARGTGALGALFFLTSITLTVMAGGPRQSTSVVDQPASSSFVDFSAISNTVSGWINGFTTTTPKPAAPAPAAPAPVNAPTEPAALSPLPEGAPPSGDVAPAPADTMTRAAPLAEPAPAAAAPARPAATVAQPRPSVTPPATVARTAPAPVNNRPASATPAAESSEPQTPAAQPRGRAGPDE